MSCPQHSQMKHITSLYSTETSSTTKVSFISWVLACFRPVAPSHPSPHEHDACACLLVKFAPACKAPAMLLSNTHMNLNGAHHMQLEPQIGDSKAQSLGPTNLQSKNHILSMPGDARLEPGLRSSLAERSLCACTL